MGDSLRFQGLPSFKSCKHFRQRDAETLGDQDECVKTTVFLSTLQRSGKSAMYMRLRSEFLLAPASQGAKVPDAAAQCFSEQLQFVSERIDFTLRSAHLRKSEGFDV